MAAQPGRLLPLGAAVRRRCRSSRFGFFALIPAAPPWAAARCTRGRGRRPSEQPAVHERCSSRHRRRPARPDAPATGPAPHPWIERIATRGLDRAAPAASRQPVIDEGQRQRRRGGRGPVPARRRHRCCSRCSCGAGCTSGGGRCSSPTRWSWRFSLVYAGEHYVVRRAWPAGCCAVVVHLAADRIERRRKRRRGRRIPWTPTRPSTDRARRPWRIRARRPSSRCPKRRRRQPEQATRLRLPVQRDLRRHPLGLGLRPARRRAEGERPPAVVEDDGHRPRRHRRPRLGGHPRRRRCGRPPATSRRSPTRSPSACTATAATAPTTSRRSSRPRKGRAARGRPGRHRLPELRHPRPVDRAAAVHRHAAHLPRPGRGRVRRCTTCVRRPRRASSSTS